jgi:hypothetical protein
MPWFTALASLEQQCASPFDEHLVWPGRSSIGSSHNSLGQGSLLCIVQPTNH